MPIDPQKIMYIYLISLNPPPPNTQKETTRIFWLDLNIKCAWHHKKSFTFLLEFSSVLLEMKRKNENYYVVGGE